MKNLHLVLILPLLFLVNLTSNAHEFKHLKLNPELEKLNSLKSKGSLLPSPGLSLAQAKVDDIIAKRILKIDGYNTIKGTGSNESLIFKKITEILAKDYQKIGQEQSNPLVLNHSIGGSVVNFSGFSWYKPMANFALYSNREIAPDLFSNKVIVHDTFTIQIDASTLLTNMKEEELIEISEGGIGAFAGIKFHRVYHYYHFADTYLEGIQSDYSKLLLTFTKFDPKHALELAPYELLQKEDLFSFNAGGFVSTPPVYGLSLRGGLLVEAAFEKKTVIQSLGANDQKKPGEFLRLSIEKKWDVSANAHMSVQLDFFKLLQLTLLSYDLEYTFGKDKKVHLNFYDEDKKLLTESAPHEKEFRYLTSGVSDKVNAFENRIIQLDDHERQQLSSKYSVLLYGGIRKNETEQIHIIKDGIEKTFYKHHSQSVKYVQSFLSRIIGEIIYKIFEFDITPKRKAESIKKLKLEYEFEQELGKERVRDEEKFSFVITHTFSAAKTHRWIDKRYKKEALYNINGWSNISDEIKSLFFKDELRGPMSLESNLRVEKSGLKYFHSISDNDVFSVLMKVCKSKRKSWLESEKRKKMLKRFQIGKSACVKSLGKKFYDYKDDYLSNKTSNMKKFRRFVGPLFGKTKHYSYFLQLFGQNNVFINGELYATTKDSTPFMTYFKTGQFKGLGVIDSFMRKDVTVIPVKKL